MNRRRWVAGAGLLAAIAVGVWFHQTHSFDLNPTVLREQIASLGWWAPLGFMAAAALRFFIGLPSMVVMSAGGLLFGFWGGTLFSTLGFSVGAALTFGIARGMGRDYVEGRLRGRLAQADEFLRKRGPRWLGMYTAIPFSVLTVVYAAAGLSSMRAASFVFWVTLGLIPRAALYSFFGDALVRDASRIWIAVGVLALAIGIGAVVSRRMLASERGRRLSEQEAQRAADSGSTPDLR